jgi:hypothetical protein
MDQPPALSARVCAMTWRWFVPQGFTCWRFHFQRGGNNAVDFLEVRPSRKSLGKLAVLSRDQGISNGPWLVLHVNTHCHECFYHYHPPRCEATTGDRVESVLVLWSCASKTAS